MSASVRVQVQGGEWLRLSYQELLAEGGEGRVYVRDELAYKLYHDPARVMPAGKLRELAMLDHPAVIRPQALLLDQHQRPLGYCMARVRDGAPLVRLFAQQFQRQRGIDGGVCLALCEAMAGVVRRVHQQGCLLVDANELNWLVLGPDYRRIAVIDVDSFQTPHYPATAQSPTIHDYQQSGFSQASDWFALAVLICQLWVGVHPYKGRHADFSPNDLAGRMRAGVSLFDPAVSLPPSARSPARIPAPWQEWLQRVLAAGERQPAPTLRGTALSVPLVPPTPGGSVTLERLDVYPAALKTVRIIHGQRLVESGAQLWLNGTVFSRPPGEGILLLPEGIPLWAQLVKGQLQLQDLENGQIWPTGIAARACFSVADRCYLLTRERLLEIRCRYLGMRWQALVVASWGVLPEATQLGEGLLFQRVFGQTRLLIPYQGGSLAQLVVPELAQHRVLGGRWEAGVAVLVGVQNGRLDRFILRFNSEHRHYQLRRQEDIPTPTWNMAVLDTGVAVLVAETLEVFFSQPQRPGWREVDGSAVTDLHLVAEGSQLLGFQSDTLYRLQLRGG